mmetsp:Transcript_144853/g.464257  ORF Transcript_144853/g.464257 Transcript_144853/m.464257 type:complete len:88 (+) Transcript_144853:1831-2094(+)
MIHAISAPALRMIRNLPPVPFGAGHRGSTETTAVDPKLLTLPSNAWSLVLGGKCLDVCPSVRAVVRARVGAEVAARLIVETQRKRCG